jgi:hypothetical protein
MKNQTSAGQRALQLTIAVAMILRLQTPGGASPICYQSDKADPTVASINYYNKEIFRLYFECIVDINELVRVEHELKSRLYQIRLPGEGERIDFRGTSPFEEIHEVFIELRRVKRDIDYVREKADLLWSHALLARPWTYTWKPASASMNGVTTLEDWYRDRERYHRGSCCCCLSPDETFQVSKKLLLP